MGGPEIGAVVTGFGGLCGFCIWRGQYHITTRKKREIPKRHTADDAQMAEWESKRDGQIAEIDADVEAQLQNAKDSKVGVS